MRPDLVDFGGDVAQGPGAQMMAGAQACDGAQYGATVIVRRSAGGVPSARARAFRSRADLNLYHYQTIYKLFFRSDR
jgi:hypothetical protein